MDLIEIGRYIGRVEKEREKSKQFFLAQLRLGCLSRKAKKPTEISSSTMNAGYIFES